MKGQVIHHHLETIHCEKSGEKKRLDSMYYVESGTTRMIQSLYVDATHDHVYLGSGNVPLWAAENSAVSR